VCDASLSVAELAVVAVMAALWWVPTFMALADLQSRSVGVPRPVVWKWLTLMCVPVLGALLYRRKGKDELEKARLGPRTQRSAPRSSGKRKRR
jgi:type VI protein secretion system component VasK